MAVKLRNLICSAAVIFMVAFHFAQGMFPAGERYPDIYWVANNAFSFAMFCLMDVYAHAKMHEVV